MEKSELRSCLIKKFGFSEVQGSKHEAVSLYLEGKKVATTRFSRSAKKKDLDDQILKLIAREIWVQTNYLKKMVGCKISKDEYLLFLQNNGFTKY
jgi:hypothetical protein